MIVSFAWTAPAFIADRKCITRREWSFDYAEHFIPGTIHQAYDKQPRFGGKQIGLLEVLTLSYEDIRDMPDEDFEFEGFAYLEEQGLMFRGQDPRIAFEEWRIAEAYYWVLRFEKIN